MTSLRATVLVAQRVRGLLGRLTNEPAPAPIPDTVVTPTAGGRVGIAVIAARLALRIKHS